MALTLSQLEAMRDALVTQISTGVRSTSFQDKRVDYQSVDDMRKALADIESSIAAANSTFTRRSYAAFSKGE